METLQQPSSDADTPAELWEHRVARVCYMALREYIPWGTLRIPSWTNAPQEDRDAAIRHVALISTGFVKCPEDFHTRFLKEQKRKGWHLGLYNEAAKTRPDLLEYRDLPTETRLRRELFFNIAKTLLR